MALFVLTPFSTPSIEPPQIHSSSSFLSLLYLHYSRPSDDKKMPLRKPPPPSPNRPSSPSQSSFTSPSSPPNLLKKHQRQHSQNQVQTLNDQESSTGKVSFFKGWPMVTKSPKTRSETLADSQHTSRPSPMSSANACSNVIVTTPEVSSVHPFVPRKQYAAPDLDPELVKAVASRRRSTASSSSLTSQQFIPPPPPHHGSALDDPPEACVPCQPMSSVGVVTDSENYILVMRLHAFNRDNITISTKRPRTLHIVADKYDDEAGAPSNNHQQHTNTLVPSTPSSTGHFERRIAFGKDADMSLISADYDGELLTVSVPRKMAKIMQGGTIVFQGGFGTSFEGESDIVIPTPPGTARPSTYPSIESLASMRQGTHSRAYSQPTFSFPDNRDIAHQKTFSIGDQIISPPTQSYVPTRSDSVDRNRSNGSPSSESVSSSSSYTPPLSISSSTFSSSANSTDDVTQINQVESEQGVLRQDVHQGTGGIDCRRSTSPSEGMASLMLSSPRSQINHVFYGSDDEQVQTHKIIHDDMPTPTPSRVLKHAA
ncbi:hypothetical protein FRC03_008471, partial [Tulasnella sp. 419]